MKQVWERYADNSDIGDDYDMFAFLVLLYDNRTRQRYDKNTALPLTPFKNY